MNILHRTLPLLLAPSLWLAGSAAAQTSYSLRSPDKKIEVRIRAAGRMQYDVLRNGAILLQDCAMSIGIESLVATRGGGIGTSDQHPPTS